MFETKDVLKMLKETAPKANSNKITLKLNLLIMTCREWQGKSKDGVLQKMYTYMGYSAEHAGVIEFNSSLVLTLNKPAEVILTLTSFKAWQGKL